MNGMGIVAVSCIERQQLHRSALNNVESLWRRLLGIKDYCALGVIPEDDMGSQKLQRSILHLTEWRMLPKKTDNAFA
jgi:hypothetical protein